MGSGILVRLVGFFIIYSVEKLVRGYFVLFRRRLRA